MRVFFFSKRPLHRFACIINVYADKSKSISKKKKNKKRIGMSLLLKKTYKGESFLKENVSQVYY